METLLRIGLSNAAFAAGLAILAAGAGRMLRRPAAAHLLWVLVLIKLLTPPIWTIPVPFPGPDRISPPTSTEISAQEDLVAPPGTHAIVAVDSTNPISRMTWLAAYVWGLGSLACLLLTVLRLRQFRAVLAFATPAPAPLQRQTGELALQLGLRRGPTVWLVPARICPMVFAGPGHSRLLLPMDLSGRLSSAQQATLLVHELAHLRRGDHLVRFLELAATIAYWWNPVVWWARHELRQAEEHCCDAWVTWALPAEAHQYASALVDAVDFASQSIPKFSPRLPVLASGIGEFGHLKRRLVMILECKGNRKMGWFGTACACALAAVLPFSCSRAQDAKAVVNAQQPASNLQSERPATTRATKENTVDPALTAKLNRELPEVKFTAVGLSDVIDFLRDVSGTKIQVDWKALEQAGVGRNTPVTANYRGIKFSKVLHDLLDSVPTKKGKVIYQPDQNTVMITVAEKGTLEVNVYQLKNLPKQPDGKARVQALIKQITDSVDPNSWGQKDGRSIVFDETTNSILVIQTPENMKAVMKLIEQADRGL